MIPGMIKEIRSTSEFHNVEVQPSVAAEGAIPISFFANQVIKVDRETELLSRPRDKKIIEEKQKQWPVLGYFDYEHLPPALQKISRPFGEMAWHLALGEVVNPAEMAVALRKLLEAKDAAVRAGLKPRS